MSGIGEGLCEPLLAAGNTELAPRARGDAARVLRAALNARFREACRSMVTTLGDVDSEVALDHVIDKAMFGTSPFLGTSDGEAWTWLRCVFINKGRDILRRRKREQERSKRVLLEPAAQPAPPPPSAAAIQRYGARMRLEVVRHGTTVDVRNFDIFLDYLLGASAEAQMAAYFPGQPRKQARNNLYQARLRGKKLAAEAAKRIDREDIDPEVAAWLFGEDS